ncbi:hypothetical protein B296_00042859 [Ensete ventricosum]|uniref:Uncharacterized protein n=1 Tax=Ensete ventricosum TaxID=4639 RepID=A0A426Y5U3_ENSVE|nr:hypothetical protein B296_00042859 [Ensete ventricosum]
MAPGKIRLTVAYGLRASLPPEPRSDILVVHLQRFWHSQWGSLRERPKEVLFGAEGVLQEVALPEIDFLAAVSSLSGSWESPRAASLTVG